MVTPDDTKVNSPAPTVKIDPPILSNANRFNDVNTEEEAIADAAYAQTAVLEAAAAFLHVVETLQFSTPVQQAVEKNLNRCINAVASEVPSQWKKKVLYLMREASKVVDEHQEQKAVDQPADTPAV